uniref:TM2 domain-containing protein n=1 Tax=Caenorhabditis tropicalis TaxID=1561998 RepID=A0A1I7U540_9PELO
MRLAILHLFISLSLISLSESDATVKCSDLDPTQYLCKNYPVDPITQQSVTCSADNSVQVMCESGDHIKCIGKDQFGIFNKTIADSCHYGAHINYSTAVLLSIFLGFFGIDRIYLGYYALGLIKMFSLGGLFVFWLVDIILISLQLLGPADGTDYAMAFYGPKVERIR